MMVEQHSLLKEWKGPALERANFYVVNSDSLKGGLAMEKEKREVILFGISASHERVDAILRLKKNPLSNCKYKAIGDTEWLRRQSTPIDDLDYLIHKHPALKDALL